MKILSRMEYIWQSVSLQWSPHRVSADLVVYVERMHTQKQKGENKRFSGFSFSRCQPTSQPESDGEPVAQVGEIYFQGVTHENYRTLGP